MRPKRVLTLHFDGAEFGALVPIGRTFARLAGPRVSDATDALRFTGIGLERLPRTCPGLRFTMDRLEGIGFLRLSHATAFALLERLLGFTGEASQAPERSLTALEKPLLEHALQPVLASLGKALASRVQVDGAADAGEGPFVVWHLDGPYGPAIDVGVPESSARTLAAELAPTRESSASLLLGAVTSPEVYVGQAQSTVAALSTLRPGMVVELDAQVGDPWVLSCAGLVLGEVRPALHEGRPHLIVTERTM